MSDSQTAQILDHLQRGKVISPLDALHRFGCMRLGARIWDLRQQGHPILKEWETDGHKKWARYSLAPASGRSEGAQ
jgi:galactose mutarotase-like enzyme